MKKHILIYCLIILSLFAEKVVAQSRSSIVKLADFSFYEGNFYEAIELYKQELEKKENNVYVLIQLGNAYQKTGDFKLAHQCFEKAYLLNNLEFPLAEFYYAQSLKTMGSYEKAKEVFEHFRKNYRGNNSSYYTAKAKEEIKSCDMALKMIVKPDFQIKALGNNVNKRYAEMGPTIYHDSILIFSTIYCDTLIEIPFEDANPKYRLYYSFVNDSTTKAQPFLPDFFTAFTGNIPDITFSADEKRMYFTECKLNTNGKLICEIYASQLNNKDWSTPIKLGPLVNDPSGEFTSIHPSIGFDKKSKQDILYFSSDKSGGNGGLDIWYAEVDAQFNIEKSYNMGRKFNTSDNEITPFIDRNTGALYYSSNGLENLGGYDIFCANDKGKSFDKPQNIGKPFNTSKDEFYFRTLDKNKFMMLSNRSDINRKNMGDDLFFISKEEKKYFKINAYQKLNDSTEQLIINPQITYTNAKDSVLFYNRYYIAKPNDKFTLELVQKGFIKNNKEFSMSEYNSDTCELKVYLEPIALNKEYRLNNIYFAYDKAELAPESKAELEQLITFLIQNPDLKIEIAAHTDNKGDANYNLKLSQERAKSVADYLVSKGIHANRLVAKGYGMTQPVAYNNNLDGSDNPEGRAQNRRIIFKVLGEINATKNEK